MDSITSNIVIDPFLVNSYSCELYLLYIIALDIARIDPYFMRTCVRDSERYGEIRSLKVSIHDSAFLSVEYTAVKGNGFLLPRIKFVRDNDGESSIGRRCRENHTGDG